MIGRKRDLAVDSPGLLLAVVVTVASVGDGIAAPQLPGKLAREDYPHLQKLWADHRYHNHTLEQLRKHA